MKNRIPTELAANGALRYGVYDKDGNLLRYEYLKLEDKPTDLGTVLAKETLLKDVTAAMFGMDADAVPDDVYTFLGKYNQHWWSIKEYTPPTLTLGAEDDSGFSFSGGPVEYSSEATVNQSGAVELSGTIKTKTLSSGSAAKSFFNSIKGQYFTLSDDVVYYKTTTNATSSGDYTCTIYCKEVSGVPGSLGNAIGYETANDAGAFPENGAVDSAWYTYLGVPFDNAVTAPKIVTGSYTGTGTYGSSNKNTLTFDFMPKMVFIAEEYLSNSGNAKMCTEWVIFTQTDIMGYARTNSQFGYYDSFYMTPNWGRELKWWSTTSASIQGNVSGTTYRYIAIG